jgi:hypothetical protein
LAHGQGNADQVLRQLAHFAKAAASTVHEATISNWATIVAINYRVWRIMNHVISLQPCLADAVSAGGGVHA